MPDSYLCDGRSFIEMRNDGDLHTAFAINDVTLCDVIFSLHKLEILYHISYIEV